MTSSDPASGLPGWPVPHRRQVGSEAGRCGRGGSGGMFNGSPLRRTAAAVANSGAGPSIIFQCAGAGQSRCRSGFESSRHWASAPVLQRPCLSMPMGTTSYLLRSMALRTEAADSSETSCSPEPPAEENADAEFLLHGCRFQTTAAACECPGRPARRNRLSTLRRQCASYRRGETDIAGRGNSILEQ